ncbi:hypothetical protein EDB86DRAFT_2834163 [Lactarius hatsudake]|nr:hypothetical protein EDB86DRAFT_2834163 [Lactarius hatsudake]
MPCIRSTPHHRFRPHFPPGSLQCRFSPELVSPLTHAMKLVFAKLNNGPADGTLESPPPSPLTPIAPTSLIPKPSGVVGRVGLWGERVRCLADEYLETSLPYSAQAEQPDRLALVCETASKEYPILLKYEGNWVVHDYLRIYLKNSSQKARKEQQLKDNELETAAKGKARDSQLRTSLMLFDVYNLAPDSADSRCTSVSVAKTSSNTILLLSWFTHAQDEVGVNVAKVPTSNVQAMFTQRTARGESSLLPAIPSSSSKEGEPKERTSDLYQDLGLVSKSPVGKGMSSLTIWRLVLEGRGCKTGVDARGERALALTCAGERAPGGLLEPLPWFCPHPDGSKTSSGEGIVLPPPAHYISRCCGDACANINAGWEVVPKVVPFPSGGLENGGRWERRSIGLGNGI